MIDPKLLFPVKEWLLSWLPGHSFKWDFVEEEEAKLREEELEESKPIHQEVWKEEKITFKDLVQFTPIGYYFRVRVRFNC